MPKEQLPNNSDPVFREVMGAIRKGKNPDHAKRQKLSAKQQVAVDKAAKDAARKRKGRHRTGGDDGVIDTGMFG